MKEISQWLLDQEDYFEGMSISPNIKYILDCFIKNNLQTGDNYTYYTYENGNIETRANIYFNSTALFKVYLQVSLTDENTGYIKVEKVRKSEVNTKRLQDIGHRLNNDWENIFSIKYFYWNKDYLDKFGEEIRNLCNEISQLDILMKDYEEGLELDLKKVTVYNFKNLSKPTSIEFNTNMKVLVGKNNSGKSSFIQGVLLGYQSLLQLSKQERLKYDKEGFLKRNSDGVRIESFPFLIGNVRDLFNVNAKNISKGVELIKFEFDNNKYIQIEAGLRGEYYSVNLTNCTQGITKSMLEGFLERPITLIPSFFTVVIDEERKSPARYNSLLKSGNYNQLFRNILLDLKESDEIQIKEDEVNKKSKFDQLVELVEEVFNVKDLEIKYEPDEDEFIKVTYLVGVEENKKQRRLDISALGMGTLQFIQVIAQVLLGKPSIILLDEPDAHLHSKLQVKIIELLNKLSEEHDIKFIVATHSKDFINNVKFNQVLSFSEDGNLISLKDSDQYVGMFKSLGVTTEEMIGINIGKRIVIVEGTDDVTYIKAICENYNLDKESNYNLINFLPLEGRGNVINNQLDVFIKGLQNDDESLQKLAIFDKDYRTIEEQEKDAEKLKKKGFTVIDWNKKELENYFIIPNVIADFINTKYPQKDSISVTQIETIIENLYKEELESIVFEYEKDLEKCVENEIRSNTPGRAIGEIAIGKADQIECRKKAFDYISQIDKKDVLSGKKILNKIRAELIVRSTPSQETFVLGIIKYLNKDELHNDLKTMLTEIQKLAI